MTIIATNDGGTLSSMKIAAALLALATSGCSMLFMERLPPRHNPKSQPYCTATKGFVAWDAGLALVHLASAVANVYVGDENDWGDETVINRTFLIGNVVGMFAHIGSATVGERGQKQCVQARRVYETHRIGGDGQ